jgi:hypothetical protein
MAYLQWPIQQAHRWRLLLRNLNLNLRHPNPPQPRLRCNPLRPPQGRIPGLLQLATSHVRSADTTIKWATGSVPHAATTSPR